MASPLPPVMHNSHACLGQHGTPQLLGADCACCNSSCTSVGLSMFVLKSLQTKQQVFVLAPRVPPHIAAEPVDTGLAAPA